MNKLIFKVGTMGAAKTLDLLAKRHEYLSKPNSGYRVITVAPQQDVRYGKGIIRSRVGIEAKADVILGPNDRIQDLIKPESLFDLLLVLVDEAQFLSNRNVESMRQLVDSEDCDATVICYGLRTNFKGRLFEGSKRLLELCNDIVPMPSVCSFCEKEALFNMRVGSYSEEEVVLGDDIYKETCSCCYSEEVPYAD